MSFLRFMIFYLKRKFKTSIVPIPGRPKIAETLAVIKFKGSEKPVSAERLSSITSEVTPLAVLKIDFIIGCLDFKIILISKSIITGTAAKKTLFILILLI